MNPFKWKCYNCGKPANYRTDDKAYCDKAWDVYLGFKPKSKLCKRKGKNVKTTSKPIRKQY